MNHPLSKYGLALVLRANGLDEAQVNKVTHEMLANSLKEGIRKFRLYTKDDPELDNNLTYNHYSIKELDENPSLVQSAGLSGRGMYLSQNILTEEKSAKQVYSAVKKLLGLLSRETDLAKTEAITMSISAVSGKINQGKLSQSNPTSSLLEVCCFAIGNIHPLKPCFASNNLNYALIPDLSLNELIVFIDFFDRMFQDNVGNLMKAKSSDGKYKRPRIIRGNYPDAPYHTVFGPIGLLASIGKWAKEADIPEGARVLKMFKGKKMDSGIYHLVPIYLLGYGKANVLYFSHYLVELAKDNKLYQIVLDLENSTLISEERKTFDNPKYQQFYLFTTRFLQLFSESSFQDFLSFRAYYEPEVIHLFNSYFINVELKHINMAIAKEIVISAREMGKWLNYAAYKAAEKSEDKSAGKDAVLKSKAKFLIELESAAFSAKSGDELISHVITRAGRLSGMDVPPEAQCFMDAVCSELITREQAQHLITAYARLRNKFERKDDISDNTEEHISAEIE
ncbi:hypothetical protein [Echinicola sp. 20G]|uniref:hypothetical protein n=1 Tax=Echinicola sp. 20G TaxID=2781961 RepID=UPI00191000EE|nr:hypothetical protein [Echinicola sp. 20G]